MHVRYVLYRCFCNVFTTHNVTYCKIFIVHKGHMLTKIAIKNSNLHIFSSIRYWLIFSDYHHKTPSALNKTSKEL